MAVLAAGAAALGGRDDSILQHLIMKIGDVMDSMSSCGLIFAVFRPCRLAYGAYGGLPNTEYHNIDNDNGITTTAAPENRRTRGKEGWLINFAGQTEAWVDNWTTPLVSTRGPPKTQYQRSFSRHDLPSQAIKQERSMFMMLVYHE
ncbi:hypothetical protein TEQG_02893 [Trichophyton equinum CBS 127.97]|uniref:Uncharacterized protein n=1 Tax=Trichophyton equinum (strain ATCC MYA-4606 / CBS 127.97) TaxID=559882 RepID=F2PPP1_TRIEC|nr:hypothetical protein TEQG_02893 [Trichophyton equinum CBS 127.97]